MNTIVYGLVKASAVDNIPDGGGDTDNEVRNARRTQALIGALTGIVPGALIGAAGWGDVGPWVGGTLGALAGGGLGYLQGRAIDKSTERFLRENAEATDILAEAIGRKKRRTQTRK